MAKLLMTRSKILRKPFCHTLSSICHNSSITHQEVAAALRPFYFAVHPDLLWQFPKEKEINENSLKLLNAYLETVLKNEPINPTSVTFCLKTTKNYENSTISFKRVNIQLLGKDLRHTVRKILFTCQLPIQNLDATSHSKVKTEPLYEDEVVRDQKKEASGGYTRNVNWWKEAHEPIEDIEQKIKNMPEFDLKIWLNENITEAQRRSESCQALRAETEKLCKELKEKFQLNDIVWNCGWGITHFRGCLLSFRALTLQNPEDMIALRDRTLVFGRQTGVSFEGHIILSSEDVRNNWLDMISSVDKFDSLLSQLPDSEKALSDVLRGITIDHRKFQPTIMIQKYIQQLGKLTSALYKYKWKNGYPGTWPRRLHKFQIVVECEAGPLMLSPTGQFIVPASCPAFLLVDFISNNMAEASKCLELYIQMKQQESTLYMKCMAELGLSALEKDDNVTPELMVKCCERLLEESIFFRQYFRDSRLRISHYYSVLQDGDVCIPWDWKHVTS